MTVRPRDSQGRFTGPGYFNYFRDRPGTSAAVVAGAAGLAAAGALLWTRREQVGGAVRTGIDRLNDYRAQWMDASSSRAEVTDEVLDLGEAVSDPEIATVS